MSESVEARLLALTVVQAYLDGRRDDVEALKSTTAPLELYTGLIQMMAGLLAQVGADNGISVRDVIENYRAGLLQVAE